MRTSLYALLLGSSLLAGAAQADAYLAIDGTALSIEDSAGEEFEPTGGRLRIGLRLSELFDLEAHVGRSREHDDGPLDEFTVSTTGAFLKAYLPVGRRSALYALAGYSRVEFEQRIGELALTDARRGAAWGFGLETRLSPRVDLSADFIRYLEDEDLFREVSAVNAGLKFYF